LKPPVPSLIIDAPVGMATVKSYDVGAAEDVSVRTVCADSADAEVLTRTLAAGTAGVRQENSDPGVPARTVLLGFSIAACDWAVAQKLASRPSTTSRATVAVLLARAFDAVVMGIPFLGMVGQLQRINYQ
jgi:hypothetical protein